MEWSKRLFDKAHQSSEERRYRIGLLGKHNPIDETISYEVPGRVDWLYVTLSDHTVVIARNEAGVPQVEDMQVKLYRDHGDWVIAGRATSGSLSVPSQTPPSGVPPHELEEHRDVAVVDQTDGDTLIFDGNDWVNLPFNERARDAIGAALVQGANVTITVDDTGNTITISATGPGGINYQFSTTTSDADPGSGKIRFNNATFGSTTQLFIDDLDAAGNDVQAWINALDDSTSSVRGHLTIFKASNPAIYRIFAISGALTDPGGYTKIAVSPIVTNGSLVDTDAVVLMFARTGDKGDTGATGATGSTGSTGATGPQGGFGGNSQEYKYSTTTTDADPGSGFVRFNNGTFASITQLFIDDNNNAGADVQAWIDSLDDSTSGVRGVLRIFKESDQSIFRLFNITGAHTDPGGYTKIAVAPVLTAGSLANNDVVVVSFQRTGDMTDIHGLTANTVLVDADEVGFWSSVATALRKITWANIKATLVNTALTWLKNVTITSADTSGSSLNVTRNLTATSTDAPVVLILQDHASDDQPALQVGQDGLADILQLLDGGTKRVYVVDGGALYQMVLAGSSVREILAKFQISDASDSCILICNGTSANNGFLPTFAGMGDAASRISFQLMGIVAPGNDSGSTAVNRYVALVTDGSSDPTNGTFSDVATRPTHLFGNNNTTQMLILANGLVLIGSLTSGGATWLGVKAGASANDAAVGGVLFETRTQTGNVGAGEDDLASFSVPADTLSANGMSLRFEAWGTFAANGNNKRVRARFGTAGTNQLFDSTALSYSGMVWRLEGRVVRTGAATQRSIVEGAIGANGGGVAVTNYLERSNALNQTLSGAVTFKITGEGVSNNDIVIDGLIIYWDDLNT